LSNYNTGQIFGVVLFHSVQGALRAEKILLSAGVQHKLIPVPRHLSSDCGFCLRFVWNDRETVKQLLGSDLGIEAVEPL
jgi:hypothetical protein